ncbi:zinc ribbon domain-containing protein [Staphylococcus simiae]|uniref:TcaA second domain-containing protein n=1 Tax=Staphylococcus simiae TaxID=308354 RepID=UPI001A95B786|nr:zinc ribbon domain-containing protein [Staphylococcus simiae]MBO1198432.1 zinc ribbon domain-containing protein [Staphylococcus simiae]MBO1200626.1 zinc ribbon domain-containing protein [Staphylococcus simiae]MBO1202897.1 zinc ribbon domain-containing protein [Staphylococcus simiae]MBO1210423.1 zinc ribbon domain-containing protein [Staphylococcus simiae]MBO1228963.1 zinc ribbon domain-containing protein [Staphylococcus simiae]
MILLVAAFLILNKQLSPKNDAANIAHAIDKNDAKGLANQVTSDGKKLNEDEAKAFLAYVKTKGNLTKVADSIQSKTSDIKDGKAKQATIYANDSTVMSITKDGKKFFLFDKYRFDIPSYKVSLSPDNDGKLTYTFNGQKHDVNVKRDDTTTLGTFPTGDYRLKATKKINNKDFDGAVLINMSNDTTMATESFKQKKFNVTTENGSELNDITIYVNGKNEGTDTSKTFGPYSPDEEVTVHAEGKIDNQIFKSDSVDVDTTNKEDGEVSDVTLKFDSDAIDKYVDAKDSKKSKSSSDSDSDKDSDSDSSSSSDEVTRSNVIDKVESYEGHKLDTDKYTFKEPEKHNGRWGFSFLDKDGDLAGSYFVDADDGYVTKFDEHGDEIGSGY